MARATQGLRMSCVGSVAPQAHAFPALHRMFNGEPRRLYKVVCIFYCTVFEDLANLDHAAAMLDWTRVHKLANRIQQSCQLVGEIDLATTFAGLAEPGNDLEPRMIYTHFYAPRRKVLLQLLKAAEDLAAQLRQQLGVCLEDDPPQWRPSATVARPRQRRS